MDYIVLAIPVFFLLIGIELLIDKLKRTNLYRFNDAITNLSCGIGQQVIGVFLKLTIIGTAYVYLYDNVTLRAWFGVRPFPGADFSAPAVIATWIILFIGVDFFYYWFHRLAHEVSILWGSHVVHHQSEEYNLTVALRQAWLQGAFSWFFYLPLAVLGFHPVMFVTVNSLQTLYQFWIHTKTINRLHPAFEYVFNTPSHHRVHHGVNPKYIDRNHGGTLIIFDRMFGTFQAEEEEVVYGITKQTNSWNPLWVNFEYWIDLFRAAWRATKWSDKIKILVKEPGWYPDELGGVQKPKEVSNATFHKYDEQAPQGLNRYVFAHYIIMLAGTTAFLFMAGKLPLPVNLLLAALVVIAVVSLGGLFEKKPWVIPLEMARLVFTGILLFYLLQGSAWALPVAGLAAALTVVSVIWLSRYRIFFYGEKFLSPAQKT